MNKIKVCGLKDPENITAISGLQPDFMGFIFYPGSKRFLGYDNDPAKRAIQQIPREITKTGVFVNEELKTIKAAVHYYTLDAVQLHGDEDPHFCLEVKQLGVRVIKSFLIHEEFDYSLLEDYIMVTDYFLFDTFSQQHGGSGKQFNWDLLNHYPFEQSFFLSGGIGPEDAKRIREISYPWPDVIDNNSRFETEPGKKDIQQVADFIKCIRSGSYHLEREL